MVTNRRDHECRATEDNLASLEMPYDVILCRTDTGDKNPRWELITSGKASPDLPPLEIVMWIGDNIEDFPDTDQSLLQASEAAWGDFGERFFVLPNPMYGSFEDNRRQ